MSVVEHYLTELDGALRVRGAARRRLLAEVREHLADAGAAHGEAEAVRRFGSAADLARSFDTEVVAQRAVSATPTTVLGVLAIGASTLVVLNAADPRASVVPPWAVLFFAAAQTSAVCTVLAALRARALRDQAATAADVLLLCRRNGSALAAAVLALFAAAAAVAGRASALAVLVGPATVVLATVFVLRARALAVQLDGSGARTVRDPVTDLRAVSRLGIRTPRRPVFLFACVAIAATSAFLWDHLDHGTLDASVTAASIEAGLTLAGYLVLGPSLGLRPGVRKRGRRIA